MVARNPKIKPEETLHGFALLEVLIAILLFSIGILGMVAMQARASQYSTDAEDRTRAALLADEMVSLMWQQQTTSPSAGLIAAWQSRVSNPAVAGLPNAAGSVSSPSGTPPVVTVTITWKSPSRTASDSGSRLTTQVAMP